MIRSSRGFKLSLPYIELKEAKSIWAEYRTQFGFKEISVKLLTPPKNNLKLNKSGKSYGLALAASRASGTNVCLDSTPVCVNACVGKNGNGLYPKVVQARIAKTRFLFEHPEEFSAILCSELLNLPDGTGVRLNTFSDIDWTQSRWLFDTFRNLRFYDYTKDWNRSPLKNYHLTYSVSERTLEEEILDFQLMGRNTAIVFSTKPKEDLPKKFLGIKVIDGDKYDDRWLDPKGVIIGLRAKGKMRADVTGFKKEV